MPGEDWTDGEIDLIVADHFSMLADDLAGVSINKAERNRTLQHLTGRSKGSIEFKHQNISAVLYFGFGLPWLSGYKPARNFQMALVDGVWRWLQAHPDWLPIAGAGGPKGRERVRESAPRLWIGPPPSHRNAPPPVDPELMAGIARKFDVAARDAANRTLGEAGENLVYMNERAALIEADRGDLAERVRWTAKEDGDGFGYDIASFEPDGRARLLEVKTTNGWERTPFHLTRNEIAVAERRRSEWHLIRLWNFAREPQAFALRPPLSQHVELTPTSFLADLH